MPQPKISPAIEKYLPLLLAASVLLVYFNSLWAPFIFDDQHMIVENLFIKNLKYIPMFFKGYVTSYPIPQGMLRPLLMFTYTFNYLTTGLCPLGYHLLNIIFHFLNAILLYFLLKSLKKDTPLGLIFALSLIFAVHPVNTEAVTYLSSRSDLMTTFFILSSFILFLKNRFLASCLLFILSLLSKETGLCLFFLVFGYTILYQEKVAEIPGKKRVFLLTVLGVSLVYLLSRQHYFHGAGARLRPLSSNILIQSWVSFFYLKLFLFPLSLNILHYAPNLTSLLQPQSLLSVSGILILAGMVIALRKKRPLLSLGIFWYLTCLLPKFWASLHFVNCEHHLYLPSIGLYIILAFLLEKVYIRHKRYFLYPAAGIICIFIFLAAIRNYEWQDSFRIWKIAVERNPYSASARNALGLEYLKIGLQEKAQEEFEKTLLLATDIEHKINGRANLAGIYRMQKKYALAIEILEPLFKMHPPPPYIYQNLGIIYMEMGKAKEAVLAWEKELKLYPASALTYTNLGLYYLENGEKEKAKTFFEKTVHYNPDSHLGYYCLGMFYENSNDIPRAIELYKKAIKAKPDEPASYYALAKSYIKNNQFEEAFNALKTTIALSNDFAQAYNDLGVLYASSIPADWKLAAECLITAKRLGYKVNDNLLKSVVKELGVAAKK